MIDMIINIVGRDCTGNGKSVICIELTCNIIPRAGRFLLHDAVYRLRTFPTTHITHPFGVRLLYV